MEKERCMELLNQIVDHVAVNRNMTETVEELLNMGFTCDELITEFNFSESDVKDIFGN